MAGGLGGLGGFGNVLQALGQSLLTSPSGNPFETLPQHMQAVQQQREHLASQNAMAIVAEKLGIPKEIASNPAAMSLLIQQLNTQKQNDLTQQYLGQGSGLTLPGGDNAAAAMNVPPSAPAVGGAAASPTVPAAPSFAGAGASARTMAMPQAALTGSLAEKGRAIFNGLVERGLSPIAAAGITGNIRGESAFSTSVMGDQGTSGGLAQWRNERLTALKQLAAKQGKPWTDPNVQLDHLVAELKGPERGALAAVNAAKTPQEAALAFMKSFERPSASAMAKSGPLRAAAASSALSLYGGRAPTQTASANTMPPASAAMQRVQEEARAKGVGQSGAPLDQVASSGKSIPVPINPPALPAPTEAPRSATGNTTKAAAQQQFELSLKRIAVAEQAGLKGIVEAEKAKLQIYSKYLTPSEAAIRVQEAGLEGTPQGRAIIAGLPAGVQEKLAEQLVPGYKAPGTLEQEKFEVAKDQQAWQRVETETARRERTDLATKRFGLDSRRYLSDLEKQQADQEYRERHFGLEKERYLSDQEKELAARDFRERQLAERTRLAEQTPAEREGRAARRSPEDVTAGKAAKVEEIGAETTARSKATALTREAEAATNAGRMAQRLMPALKQAKTAFNELKNAGTGQFGGIGPSANNPAARAIAARMPEWSPAFKNEVNRQKFDSAMASIRAAKTAVDLKGQGAVSNFERTLAGADLPDPASVSAKVVEDAFTRLETQLNAALELDRKLGFHAGEQAVPKADDWLDIGGGVRVRRK